MIVVVLKGSSIYSDSARDNYKKVADDIFQQQIPNIPAKRLGTPEEVSIMYLTNFSVISG